MSETTHNSGFKEDPQNQIHTLGRLKEEMLALAAAAQDMQAAASASGHAGGAVDLVKVQLGLVSAAKSLDEAMTKLYVTTGDKTFADINLSRRAQHAIINIGYFTPREGESVYGALRKQRLSDFVEKVSLHRLLRSPWCGETTAGEIVVTLERAGIFIPSSFYEHFTPHYVGKMRGKYIRSPRNKSED